MGSAAALPLTRPPHVGVQIVEILLRMLVGRVKSVTFAHIPAGQMRYQVILTLAVVMLALTLCSGSLAKE